MKKTLLTLIFLPLLFSYCVDLEDFERRSKEKKARYSKYSKAKIDYSNKAILDSLIKVTSISTDTIFLGFRMGMNKSEYKSHIKKLRDEGKKISYSSSNNFSNFLGKFNLGSGYTFETFISSNIRGKIKTGLGRYFLSPVYNNGGQLITLDILPIEKWDESNSGYSWLETKIKQNSDAFQDIFFSKAILDNDLISSASDLIRVKNNVIILENYPKISYNDLKTIYLELLIKVIEKDIKIEASNNTEIGF